VAESALPPAHSSRPSTRAALLVLVLPLALVVALVLATMVGSVSIPPQETVQILLHRLGLLGGQATWPSTDQTIIWEVRLPRVIAAALVGGALGVAGTLFQAVLRNPLADPYVIGTSAGAQLGVVIALVLPAEVAVLGFGSIQLLAFVGALATVLFVYAIARTGGRTPVITLLLAGFVVSSFLISGTSFLLSATNRTNQVLTWTMGSMDVSDLKQLATTGPLMLLVAGLSYLLSPRLDVVLLGEEQAAHLGVRVERLKLVCIVLASLLTALAVTLAGVVAFVGLVVPHTARLIYGPRHRLLIPAAACGGAVFVVAADALSRLVLAPTVVPLGAVTALVGAPFFLHLLRRSRRDYAV
jgi:iron complex transport system permease protein